MKVLFLDFDGVLNSQDYRDRYGSMGAGIDKSKMPMLKKLVDTTNAKIVIITSLREYWDKDPDKCDYFGKVINETFAEYGLEIYDKTPVSESGMREDDIRDWICENSGIENYVAIDDGALFARFLVGHFVQPKDGLEEEHVEKAIKILTNN
jgi:hypothetical protein